MKYIIVVDEKPVSCEECCFYSEDFEQVNSNTFSLVNRCIFTKCNYESCPLTVVNTIFTDDFCKKDGD